MMRFLSSLCFVVLLIVSTSCCCRHKCRGRPMHSCKTAWLNPCAICSERLDEVPAEELVVDFPLCPTPFLARKAYESLDAWVCRIHQKLLCNREQILIKQDSLSELEEEQSVCVGQLQRLLMHNQSLKSEIEEFRHLQSQRTVDSSQQLAPLPPFHVHLVQPGDTLYSLAAHYCGSGDKAMDLIQWNQGWIRYPEQMLAGLALVIYPVDAKETGPRVLQNYLASLDLTR